MMKLIFVTVNYCVGMLKLHGADVPFTPVRSMPFSLLPT